MINEVMKYLNSQKENEFLAKEKVETFQGLTFINIYEKENDDTTLQRFKRDMSTILKTM